MTAQNTPISWSTWTWSIPHAEEYSMKLAFVKQDQSLCGFLLLSSGNTTVRYPRQSDDQDMRQGTWYALMTVLPSRVTSADTAKLSSEQALCYRWRRSLWVGFVSILTLLHIQNIWIYFSIQYFPTSTRALLFGKVLRTRPFVLVWLDFECLLIKYGVKHGTWCRQHKIRTSYFCMWTSFDIYI
jgi:hypothetical protein